MSWYATHAGFNYRTARISAPTVGLGNRATTRRRPLRPKPPSLWPLPPSRPVPHLRTRSNGGRLARFAKKRPAPPKTLAPTVENPHLYIELETTSLNELYTKPSNCIARGAWTRRTETSSALIAHATINSCHIYGELEHDKKPIVEDPGLMAFLVIFSICVTVSAFYEMNLDANLITMFSLLIAFILVLVARFVRRVLSGYRTVVKIKKVRSFDEKTFYIQ